MTVAGGLALLDLKPEAIVLDLMLPDGDGLDVLRKVRSERLRRSGSSSPPGIEDRDRLEEIRRLAARCPAPQAPRTRTTCSGPCGESTWPT